MGISSHDMQEISAGMDGYEDGAPAAEGKDVKAHEANENAEVCAICLNAIELEELATIKGCEHEYCGEFCPDVGPVTPLSPPLPGQDYAHNILLYLTPSFALLFCYFSKVHPSVGSVQGDSLVS